nr:bulb-type lectin domain-containing protein [Tanacetum cinerariifolium]
GYMNVSFNNKWNEIAKLLGLAQENQEVVKECYKEFIGMVKIYYEEAKRSKQERSGKEVVGKDRGTVRLKEPQAFAGMNAEIVDPTVECSLIKGMEDLKMEKDDVQDYIDDEYLSMNGTYAMK